MSFSDVCCVFSVWKCTSSVFRGFFYSFYMCFYNTYKKCPHQKAHVLELWSLMQVVSNCSTLEIIWSWAPWFHEWINPLMDSNFDQLVGGGRTVKRYVLLGSFEELDFILAYSLSILDQFDLSVECYFFLLTKVNEFWKSYPTPHKLEDSSSLNFLCELPKLLLCCI